MSRGSRNSKDSIDSAANTPDLSPEVEELPRFYRRDALNSMFIKPLVNPVIVRQHLTINQPTISEALDKTIKARIKRKYISNYDLPAPNFQVMTPLVDIFENDIFILNDSTAIYNATFLNHELYTSQGFMIQVATKRSDRYVSSTNDYRKIMVKYSKDAQQDPKLIVNPSKIIGVVKPEDGEIYRYWSSFIDKMYELYQKSRQSPRPSPRQSPRQSPMQTAGKRGLPKYLYMGTSRKKIYIKDGKRCVSDGKYKNGKTKYVTIETYKKKRMSK
jgi:hypothetical protein